MTKQLDSIQQQMGAHCPGPEAETAGKLDGCAGCPNQAACTSGVKQQDQSKPEITKNLANVKHRIMVLSGKGGVGKSTVSTNVAHSLAADSDTQVSLLDLDICGPSIPKMTGLEGESIHSSNSGWSPVYVSENLSVIGPKKNAMIKQFLKDVDWGSLDYLIVDTPPGTSDEHLSVVQLMDIDGVVLVTTPQEIALQDVRKEINFCKKTGLNIIGVVENMSHFVCPNCKVPSQVFPPNSGGAVKMCKELNVNFLGSIPIDPRIAKSCDLGESLLDLYPNSPSAIAYQSIVEKIKVYIQNQTANK